MLIVKYMLISFRKNLSKITKKNDKKIGFTNSGEKRFPKNNNKADRR